MKTILALLCAFATAVCAFADQYYDSATGITWTYQRRESYDYGVYVTLTGVSGASGNVTIRSFPLGDYDNYGNQRSAYVTEIGSRAFSSCTSITSVALPSGVSSIASDAFYGCSNLARFEMEGSSSVGMYRVINGCLYNSYSSYPSLVLVPNAATDVKIASGTTSLNEPFNYCTKLKSVYIPPSLVSMGYEPFRYATALRTVYFEAGDGARVRKLFEEASAPVNSLSFVRKMPLQYHELYPIASDGVYIWTADDTETKTSGISLRSPVIKEYQSSYFTFRLEAWKSVSWWWKVCDAGVSDDLICYIDGQQYYSTWGGRGWSEVTIPYSSSARTIKIEYKRSWGYGDDGNFGCWIDGLIAKDESASSEYKDLYSIVGDGRYEWTKDSAVSKTGTCSYRSAAIGNSASTYITFTADVSKGVSWWWKVSSEASYDCLKCYINGSLFGQISGEQDWAQVSVPSSYGTCTIKFQYSKDSSGSRGSDCGWVDGLVAAGEPNWITEALTDGSVAVIGPSTAAGDVTITNRYDGHLVSTVGAWLLECCTRVSSVELMEGITTIKRGAFADCTSLGSVKLPNSLVKIEADAFRNTALMTGAADGIVIVDDCVIGLKGTSSSIVVLPKSVRLVADGVFTNSCGVATVCTDVGDSERIRELMLASGAPLDEISIVEKTTISFDANGGSCAVASGTYVPGRPYGDLPWPELDGHMFDGWYTSKDGGSKIGTTTSAVSSSTTYYAHWTPITWLYTVNKDNSVTVTGSVPRAVGRVRIPEQIGGHRVTGLGGRAFYGSDLTDLSIPAGLERIDSAAVEQTPFWVNRPDGPIVLGEWVIGCNTANAGDVKLSEVTIPDGVTSIANEAFKSKTYLSTVHFPQSLRVIGNSAFEGCYCLKRVQIPEGVVRIGDTAFASCTQLSSVTIPTTIKYIGTRAFARSSSYSYYDTYKNITSISIVATNLVVGSYAFYEQPYDYVTIDGKDITIGDHAFARSSGSYVQASTWVSASVLLRGDGIEVGDMSFACVLHPDVELDLTGVTSIGAYAFAMAGYNKGYLNSDSYYGLGGVTVKLSSKLRHADVTAFSGSALGWVYVQNLQDVFNIDGWLGFTSCEPSILSGYYRLLDVDGRTQSSIDIPNGITLVPMAAFCGIHLTSINVPTSVRSIEADAFYRCRASRIELPPTLDTLGEYALADNSFTDIRIPSGVTELATNVLRLCSSLKRTVVPATVRTIRGGAFAQCTSLESIVFWGDAPFVEASNSYGWQTFYGVPTSCVIYAKTGAAGWDDDGDGLWNGFTVRRFDPCTLTLNTCGGTAAVNSIACGVGIPVGTLPTPTRDGYRFVGWYTSTQGGSVIDEASQLSGSRTCYAQWEREYKITYEGADGFINWNPTCYTASDAITFDPLYKRASSDTLNIPNGFVEWSPKQIVARTTGDLVVSARWVRVSAEVRSELSQEGVFTIDYTVDGGYPLVDADVIVSYVSSAKSGTAQSLTGDVSCSPGKHTVHWDTKADGVDLSNPLKVTVKLCRDPGTLTYEHDKSYPWQSTTSVQYNGMNSWESGRVSGGSSTMTLKVNRTGTLSFVWKVSSEEYYDSLLYYVDGRYRNSISGTVGWTSNVVAFTSGSDHKVLLTYHKDDEDSAGSDCGWVSDIVWTPALNKYIDVSSASIAVTTPCSISFTDVRCGNETRWVQSGSAIGELPAREQSGYVFEGWYTASEGGVLVTPEMIVEGTLTVYAHWRIGESTVTFDPQGGKFVSAVDNPRIISGGAALGELPQVVRTGYDFTGWSYNGSSVDATTVLAGDVTVRAQWIAHVYSIAYHPTDGTGTMPNLEMTYGVAKALSANAFARTGYRFLGWGTQPAGGVVYGAGASVSNLTAVSSGLIDLYAQWEAKSYELRFYANDGTGEMANQTLVYDAPQSIRSCTFERIGYDFTGWRDASGNGYADGQSVVNLSSIEGAVIDLTAQWSLHAYLVGEVLEGPWQTGGNNVAQGFVDSSSSAGFSVKLTTAKSSESWVELTVTNATRVVFDWKTSCEEEEGGEMFDGMTLSVDGVPAQTLCGESGWVTDVVQEVAGTGVHTLRWTYAKDSRVNAGEDCAWLANVRIYPVVEVTFDGNGHDAGVVPAAVKGCEGDSFALPSPGSLAKACHEFAGWQVGDDVLAACTLVSIVGQDMTIKAVWRDRVVPLPVVTLPSGVSDREGQKYFTTESITVEVSAAANATVRYTTDGSDPTELSPVLTGGAFVVDRTMVLKLKAFADDWFASEIVEVSFLRAPWTVSECLNDKLSFASTGDAGWTRDLAVSHDGMASMRSGAIGNRQTSVLTATVNGAGRISFWCKVSSEFDEGEACDGLRFYVDGVEMTTELLGGEMAWTNLSYDVGTDGAHVLKWQYEKDRGDYAAVGSDCAWLDEVCWCPDVVAPTLDELANVFGEDSDVAKNITNEAELAVFNGFLKECSISSAADLSTAQMQYAFQSFKLSEIMTAPQLFEAEPVLKIDDLELSGGNLSLTISLTAGAEAIQLAKDRLAEKIRVGTSLDSIVGAPSILDSPSADGTSLTFTISPPQGGQGFVKVIVE